jgi:hypothetical protein
MLDPTFQLHLLPGIKRPGLFIGHAGNPASFQPFFQTKIAGHAFGSAPVAFIPSQNTFSHKGIPK